MNTTIIHKPTGREVSFDAPKDALLWLKQYRDSSLNENDLEMISPINRAVFGPKVPEWAFDMLVRINDDFGISPKEIHWITKKSYLSTGRSWPRIGKMTMSCGTDVSDAKGVLLHEMSHLMCPEREHHGRTFYRTLFKLLRKYLPITEEMATVRREEGYKKSSRYWYAEMYNISLVLDQYRSVAAASKPRLTPQEKAEKAMDLLFKEI